MKKSRRKFIQAGVLGGAGIATGGFGLAANAESTANKSKQVGDQAGKGRYLNILILGGTGFIGPHMVREALRRGHRVSLFNRGQTNDSLFPDLPHFVGDRDNGLDSLKGHRWDAVIDNSGYVPRHVADSAALLASAVSHYLYVSTISVYASFLQPNSEDSPLGTMANENNEEVTGETYGPLKALCEKRVAEQIAAEDLTILRPTYICGPGDRTDRFSYWPIRTASGGDMLWPGTRNDPVQIIDVRDLATFTIDCIERKTAGIYNTVTPAGMYDMGQLHDDCLAVSAADMKAIWVDNQFVAQQNLGEGRDLPIWAAPDGEARAVALVDGARAVAAGLNNRPVRETARDTLTWWSTLPAERTASLRAGLSAAREAEALAAWESQKG